MTYKKHHIETPVEPSPWKPIEEAPKDGTRIWIWCYYDTEQDIPCEYIAIGCSWVSDREDEGWKDCDGEWVKDWFLFSHFMIPPPGPEKYE